MKKLIEFSLLTIVILLLASCKNEQEVYDLGFIGTLSGQYAEVGIAEMYGAQMAVDEINEAGGINGRQIKLHVRDDEADPEIAVSMQNELYELGIDIIIGHSLSIVALEAVENADEKGILLLSPSIGTDELTGLDDSLIRNVATVIMESEYITEKILATDATKILMLYNLDNLVLTKYHLEAFENVMLESSRENDYLAYGFESNNDEHLQDIKDYLSSGEYDSVFIASANIDAAGFVNFIKSNEYDIDIHLTSWASTGIIENIETADTDNIFGYINYDTYNQTEKYLSFVEEYETTYGKQANMLCINGYDMVQIFKEASESIDSFNNLSVKEEILRISTFDGINSTFSFDEFGDNIREHVQLIIVDGSFIKND